MLKIIGIVLTLNSQPICEKKIVSYICWELFVLGWFIICVQWSRIYFWRIFSCYEIYSSCSYMFLEKTYTKWCFNMYFYVVRYYSCRWSKVSVRIDRYVSTKSAYSIKFNDKKTVLYRLFTKRLNEIKSYCQGAY